VKVWRRIKRNINGGVHFSLATRTNQRYTQQNSYNSDCVTPQYYSHSSGATSADISFWRRLEQLCVYWRRHIHRQQTQRSAQFPNAYIHFLYLSVGHFWALCFKMFVLNTNGNKKILLHFTLISVHGQKIWTQHGHFKRPVTHIWSPVYFLFCFLETLFHFMFLPLTHSFGRKFLIHVFEHFVISGRKHCCSP
jgi:hypothetical protein